MGEDGYFPGLSMLMMYQNYTHYGNHVTHHLSKRPLFYFTLTQARSQQLSA